MGEAHNRVKFGMVGELLGHMLLRKAFIDRFVKTIHPAERIIVVQHCSLISILSVHEEWSKAKKNKSENRQEEDKRLALLMKNIKGKLYYITVPRQAVLKEMCDISVLVSAKADGRIKVSFHGNITKSHV